MFTIDKEKRRLIITNDVTRATKIINEGESLDRKFLEGTVDKYNCVLKLIDVEVVDPKTGESTGAKDLKAFAQRVGNPNWVIEFTEEEYNIE